MIERVYRVVGKDRNGDPSVSLKPNESSARNAASTLNASAAKQGWPTEWCAEYADIEWKPLT